MVYITFGLTIVTVIVNILATAIPLGGMDTKTISDSFKVFFVPAGYVFSIWGVIYIALFVFAFTQLKKKLQKSKLLEDIRSWYILSCLANISWIFLWQYHFATLSIVPMIVLLISLIQIYYKISKSKEVNEDNNKLLIKLPFSIYLGWISVATIANAAVFLYLLNWDGLGIAPQFWSAIMIMVAGILGVAMLWKERDYEYVLVLIWAIIGILVKFINVSRVVSYASLFVIMLLSSLCIVMYLDHKRELKKKLHS